MDNDKTVTIRFKATQEQIDNLVTSWMHDEGVVISVGGGLIVTDLRYVREER